MSTKYLVDAPPSAQTSSQPRRRLEVLPPRPDSRWVAFKVRLRRPKDVLAFYQNSKKAKRSVSDRFMVLIEQIGSISPKSRNRRGVLQPQVPLLLRDRFKRLSGQRGGAFCLRDSIERWVDPVTGKRRTNRRGNYILPANWEVFFDRGKDLVSRAARQLDGDKLVRYTFDAGRSKAGITRLSKKNGLTISEFFSALMDRICEELGK